MADLLRAMVVIELILRMIGLALCIAAAAYTFVKIAQEARKDKGTRRKQEAEKDG